VNTTLAAGLAFAAVFLAGAVLLAVVVDAQTQRAPLARAAGRLPSSWRWLHAAYAWAGGYFWTPCPVCGEKFGGHQWLYDGPRLATIPAGANPNVRTAVCPACADLGRGRHT
jgi:hypothetical protein